MSSLWGEAARAARRASLRADSVNKYAAALQNLPEHGRRKCRSQIDAEYAELVLEMDRFGSAWTALKAAWDD